MPRHVGFLVFLFLWLFFFCLASYFERLSTTSRHSCAPTDSRMVCPVAVTEPSLIRFFFFSVRESIPRTSAIFSQWSSAAISVCGAPKPRNAPLGGVFVARTFDRTRTLGQE